MRKPLDYFFDQQLQLLKAFSDPGNIKYIGISDQLPESKPVKAGRRQPWFIFLFPQDKKNISFKKKGIFLIKEILPDGRFFLPFFNQAPKTCGIFFTADGMAEIIIEVQVNLHLHF